MFEFLDPCESCPVPLDSPACEHCPYSKEICDKCPFDLGSAACWGNGDCPFQL